MGLPFIYGKDLAFNYLLQIIYKILWYLFVHQTFLKSLTWYLWLWIFDFSYLSIHIWILSKMDCSQQWWAHPNTQHQVLIIPSIAFLSIRSIYTPVSVDFILFLTSCYFSLDITVSFTSVHFMIAIIKFCNLRQQTSGNRLFHIVRLFENKADRHKSRAYRKVLKHI